MFFKFSTSWWNSLILKHSVKTLRNNIKIRAYLYELGTECRLATNWGSEFAVFSNFDVKKRKGIIHLNFNGKLSISMLQIMVIFEFLNLIDVLIKKKSVMIMSLRNYRSKFRRAFFKPNNFFLEKDEMKYSGMVTVNISQKESLVKPSI